MKYLHYIFFERCELDADETYVAAIRIKHSGLWLYACDLSSFVFFDWVKDFGAKRASVLPSDIDKVSFNISRKFTIVAWYKYNNCIESCSMEYLMRQYWKTHREDGIPDLVKYLNLYMSKDMQFLCNPNLFGSDGLY